MAAFAALGVFFPAAAAAAAEELPAFEAAAEKVQAATLTVRVTGNSGAEETAKVTVFSGVSLGDGLMVTPLFIPNDSTVRVTVPGGAQAEAEPLVLDEYSGLALFQLDRRDVPGLARGRDEPKVGAWVLSAAAWGAEKPVVSFGLVSGIDRTLKGANYPPLIQCDLRTAETSSGAPLVSRAGDLLGIVVATESLTSDRGWTYAVPVAHVERMLRAHRERESGESPDGDSARLDDEERGYVVLKRRRPVVGMVLGVLGGDPDDAEGVVVKRVTAGSPAERAGIVVGDRVVSCEGLEVRSVYQAVRPVLFKKPGDTLKYVMQQARGLKEVEIVLGGGVVLPSAPGIDVANVLQPKIVVSDSAAVADVPRGHLAEVGVDGDEETPAGEADGSIAGKLGLLEKALDRYRIVIGIQHGQISRREQELREAEQQIEALKLRIQELEEGK